MTHVKAIIISVLILAGICVLHGYDPDKELVVYFTSSTVSMPYGQDSCSVDSLNAPDTVLSILNLVGQIMHGLHPDSPLTRRTQLR